MNANDQAARLAAAFGPPRIDPNLARIAARRAEAAARGAASLARHDAACARNSAHLWAEVEAEESGEAES